MTQPLADDPCAPGATAVVVDSRGRACPLPVIDLAKAVADVPIGADVLLLADDPAAGGDIPAWCRMRGQRLVAVADCDAHTRYLVRRLV